MTVPFWCVLGFVAWTVAVVLAARLGASITHIASRPGT